MSENDKINNFIFSSDETIESGLEYINNFFSKQVEYINAKMIGGKINSKEAYKQYKKIFREYKKIYKGYRNRYGQNN